ncbi:sugar O-acetyltransferase [Ectobacillus panaciterrae]|uniref:sugar O-acetyltransferase n=1 Tax=Ectobacillus panaciterrae TaxID=363872 RepID=UPI0004022337|nr:sugar O-acetyltransferase [Ectobacillus panaciterrae]
MSVKEKMRLGEMYCGFDNELVRARENAKKLTRLYNLTTDAERDYREMLINKLFGKHGLNTFIEPNFRCEFGYNIEVGDNFFANFDCIILDCGKIKIGNNVWLGPRVQIYSVNHVMEPQARKEGYEIAAPVNIADNVWVGGNTVINMGVSIGENSIIGSGSVVTKDIPANVVAVGNPCRVIKKID